jgi:hypothetical protein
VTYRQLSGQLLPLSPCGRDIVRPARQKALLVGKDEVALEGYEIGIRVEKAECDPAQESPAGTKAATRALLLVTPAPVPTEQAK